MEGWIFQREGGERTRIQNLYEGFHEGLKVFKERGDGLIPKGVYIGE